RFLKEQEQKEDDDAPSPLFDDHSLSRAAGGRYRPGPAALAEAPRRPSRRCAARRHAGSRGETREPILMARAGWCGGIASRITAAAGCGPAHLVRRDYGCAETPRLRRHRSYPWRE